MKLPPITWYSNPEVEWKRRHAEGMKKAALTRRQRKETQISAENSGK